MAISPLIKPYAMYMNTVRGEEISEVEFQDIELKHYEQKLIGEKFAGADSVGRNLVIYIGEYAVYIDFQMHGRLFQHRWDAKNSNLIRLKLKIGNKYFYIYAAPVVRVYPKNQIGA